MYKPLGTGTAKLAPASKIAERMAVEKCILMVLGFGDNGISEDEIWYKW